MEVVALVPSFLHPASLLPFPSLGLSCSGTARGADGPSVIQRGMFHVHLAQAQIPPAGKLFSGQPPVIRGLVSTTQHNIVLSLTLFFFPSPSSSSFYALFFFVHPATDIHICLLMNLFTSLHLPVDGVLSCLFITNSCAVSAPPLPLAALTLPSFRN